MRVTQAEIDNCLKRLEETLVRLKAAVPEGGFANLERKPGNHGWSCIDILAHLRACADVWGETIEKMLVLDEPKLPHLHPRAWMKQTDYPDLPFEESFSAFDQQRRALLARLDGIPFEDWLRGAEIKGRQHTVFSQVRRMALHEEIHWQQLKDLQLAA